MCLKKQVRMNFVFRDNVDMEHAQSVISVRKLLTIRFKFTQPKINCNYLFVTDEIFKTPTWKNKTR